MGRVLRRGPFFFYLDWKNIMSNALRIWNNWVSLSSQAAMLPLHTQGVIALRLMRIAGGALARSDAEATRMGTEAEATRMGTEKVQAVREAQAVAPFGSITGNRRQIAKKSRAGGNRRRIAKKSMAGRNRRHIAKKVAGVYKKRGRGNRRRLTR
jgi:hypothetical protein